MADASLMGILQRMWTAAPPEERLLAELAEIAGRHQELADRLARHANLCAYPNIASGLRALAVHEAEHARTLDMLLSERHVWSKLPRPTDAEGSSNWQRVSGDLALMLELSREMNEQALHWERIEPPFAARLHAIALEDNRNIGELRELALKCDPQALD
jgi:rubrerythrin